jgi:hypothetical protein
VFNPEESGIEPGIGCWAPAGLFSWDCPMASDDVDCPEWVTCAQASRKLKRSRDFVERLARDQFIATTRLGGRTYYRAMDVAWQASKLGVGSFNVEGFGPVDASEPEPEESRNGSGDALFADLRSKYLR